VIITAERLLFRLRVNEAHGCADMRGATPWRACMLLGVWSNPHVITMLAQHDAYNGSLESLTLAVNFQHMAFVYCILHSALTRSIW
jgi:hypothetical protein